MQQMLKAAIAATFLAGATLAAAVIERDLTSDLTERSTRESLLEVTPTPSTTASRCFGIQTTIVSWLFFFVIGSLFGSLFVSGCWLATHWQQLEADQVNEEHA